MLKFRYIEETFDNWGSTLLANVTVRTFFPRTVVGVQNIVRNASSLGARVRAAATRHTFNPWLWGVESNVQPGTQVCCHTVMCHTVMCYTVICYTVILSCCIIWSCIMMSCHNVLYCQGQNTDYIIAMLPLSVSDRFAYHRY